jgi:predicted Zn-dependent protease
VQQALALDDKYPDAYVILGQIYLFLNRHDEAVAFAKKAIELSPSHSLARASLAMIQNYAGHPEEAILLLKKAMRLSPYYPDWFLGELGRAYLLTGQYDMAINALNLRLDRNADSGEAYILLAATYGSAGQLDKAHQALAEFQKPRPGYTLNDYANGEFYRNTDDLNRVLDGLRKAGLAD